MQKNTVDRFFQQMVRENGLKSRITAFNPVAIVGLEKSLGELVKWA